MKGETNRRRKSSHGPRGTGLTVKDRVFREYADSLLADKEKSVDQLFNGVSRFDSLQGKPVGHATVRKWRRNFRKWLLDEIPAGLKSPYHCDEQGARIPEKSEDYADEIREKIRTKRNTARSSKPRLTPPSCLSDDDGDTHAHENGGYRPDERDQREIVNRQIRERRGRQQFRDALRKRYGDRCLITGCEVLAVLEAAHIKPYRGENDNHPGNGLLLRADLHTLFDLDLIGIDPEQLRVKIVPELSKDKMYGHLDGKRINCRKKSRPSKNALVPRYTQFQQRNQA